MRAILRAPSLRAAPAQASIHQIIHFHLGSPRSAPLARQHTRTHRTVSRAPRHLCTRTRHMSRQVSHVPMLVVSDLRARSPVPRPTWVTNLDSIGRARCTRAAQSCSCLANPQHSLNSAPNHVPGSVHVVHNLIRTQPCGCAHMRDVRVVTPGVTTLEFTAKIGFSFASEIVLQGGTTPRFSTLASLLIGAA